MEAKISIIMPSLNVGEQICECMESVLSQTMKEVEIICVDAGSTDGTYEILKKYASQDNRIRLVPSEKKSYGYQLNLGIRRATGKYIGIVDTDDYVAPNMFERMYDLAEKHEVDFVNCLYTKFFEFGGRRCFYRITQPLLKEVYEKKIDLQKDDRYRLAHGCQIWTGLYNRRFITDNQLWLHETPGASFQDLGFHVLVGLMAKTCVYTEGSYYFYRTDRAESSVRSSDKYKCVADEVEYINRYLQKNNLDTEKNRMLVRNKTLSSYRWNLLRLSDDSQKLFMNYIKNDMDKISQGEMNEEQKEIIRLLTDYGYLKEYEEQEERNRKLTMEIVRKGKEREGYVFVGTGGYFEKYMTIQQMYGGIITAVCDNNKAKQGSQIEQYKVLSVEEACECYGDSEWLIANKNHANDIEEQLLHMGIRRDKITKVNVVPEPISLM